MRSVLFSVVIAMFLLAAILMPNAAQGQKKEIADTKAAQVDEMLKKWDRAEAPGCVVAVVKDGQIVYHHSGGAANLEFGIPLTLSTLFMIASLSKQFTVFAIMLLLQGGRLSLDDDIRKHVPELQDFGQTITIRHLIHHTSGLREWHTLREYAGLQQDDVGTEKDFINMVSRQKELNFPPGAEYSYCNTGYHLLGLIVKRASGKSLRQFADEQIFKPLEMKSTLFKDDYRLVLKNFASSYTPKGDGFQHSFLVDGITGATNLHTNALDLAKWDQNFYDAKVGGQKVIDLMHVKGKLADGKEIPYAGGLIIGDYRGQKTVEHTGSRAGFRTVLLRFPDQRFSVIVLANRSDGVTTTLARQIADIYLAEKLGPTKKSAAANKDDVAKKGMVDPNVAKLQLTADEMKEFMGDFYCDELDVVYHVTMKDGKLTLRHRKGESMLTPVAGGKFTCVLAGTSTLEYSRDANKRVSGFKIGVPSCRGLSFVRVELAARGKQ